MRRVIVLCALAACGGGDHRGDPIAPDDATRICNDFEAHATACGWGNNLNEADWNCPEAAIVWRADVFQAVADCGMALACTDAGSPCLLMSLDATPLPIHDDYAETCAARVAECNLMPTSNTQETLESCSADALAAYATPVMDTIIDCFAVNCTSIGVCLDGTL